MSKLDHLLENARHGDAWTEDRARRVFGGMRAKHERRLGRAKLVRRGIIAGSVAAFFGLVLLRGAGASTPAPSSLVETPVETHVATSEALAAHASNDGGYARD